MGTHRLCDKEVNCKPPGEARKWLPLAVPGLTKPAKHRQGQTCTCRSFPALFLLMSFLLLSVSNHYITNITKEKVENKVHNLFLFCSLQQWHHTQISFFGWKKAGNPVRSISFIVRERHKNCHRCIQYVCMFSMHSLKRSSL